MEEGRSLAETPTYLVAAVVTVMVVMSFFFEGFLEWAGKWLENTKRGSLLAALEKIKEELMVFGVLSLLMGHWIGILTKICIKASAGASRFFPCESEKYYRSVKSVLFHVSSRWNESVSKAEYMIFGDHSDCPTGKEPLASKETLEQLHRLLFVLAFVHVSYSFNSIVLALAKIYSWRTWENQAKSMPAMHETQGSSSDSTSKTKVVRLTSFVFHHTSHSWSQRRVLVWLLCFSRQFWSSINRADYIALRFGFISTHGLPLTYDFHNYMLRSMEEEFRDIVGISLPLWVYAILCMILDFHGSVIYFWLSFLPSILILLLGTKLHRVVVKLAVEIKDPCPVTGKHLFRLRDDLFWFGRPRLLLQLIQIISFQNAFEMATFIWSLWEIKNPSCFMDNRHFMVTRLVFGVASQCWCSYITFPLYLIVTQMGSRFNKSIVSQDVRRSLSGWQHRAQSRQNSTARLLSTRSTTSMDFLWESIHRIGRSRRRGNSSSRVHDDSTRSDQLPKDVRSDKRRHKSLEELLEEDLPSPLPGPGSFTRFEDHDHRVSSGTKEESCLLPRP